MRGYLTRLRELLVDSSRALLPSVVGGITPLDLRFVGRTVVQTVLVGVGCGLIGALFFAALENMQHLTLERLGGYVPLRASGEVLFSDEVHTPFRPWLVALLPALGGLACGWLARRMPEVRGGGGDTMIRSFHEQGGHLPARIIPLKALASLVTLGTGGAGGREGPTMLIGGAIGSGVARQLGLGARERRILLVAGVAAGISAVFRTPLGAALLAVEVLYRDGFESDALIPAVLASVVAYSVVITIFGESTLLAHAPRFPFVPSHLMLYALLAIIVALVGLSFLRMLRSVRGAFERFNVPLVLRPGIGGLALGVIAVGIIVALDNLTKTPGQGFGILGGGYGAAQMAVTGSEFLPSGWPAVAMLAGLCVAKVLAASLTIGSGGSAGDFAPSLAIGALLGGAFGRAAQLLLQDPRIDPGAFALVGMGTFYGGIAHVPLSALVLVCEMAGNYDLLVPLMLSLGIAYVSLRRETLYEAQVATQRDSPAYRDLLLKDALRGTRVRELMSPLAKTHAVRADAHPDEVLSRAELTGAPGVLPVLDKEGRIAGAIPPEAVRAVAREEEDVGWTVAADLMRPAVTVQADEDLMVAAARIAAANAREAFVLDDKGQLVGLLAEADVARSYIARASRAEDTMPPTGVRGLPPRSQNEK